MYEYYADVTKVYDGDTITVTIDLGFDHFIKDMSLRLLGIDTPELSGGTEETRAAGREARDFLRSLILGQEVVVKTVRDKTGKYGRYLATIFTEDDVNANELLLLEGYAEEYPPS